MHSIEASEAARRTAASAVLAYKLHQGRAADCGDFEACYGNAGAVRAFAVMTVADLAFVAACIAQRRSPRAWARAYGATAATATAGLAILFEW